MKNDPISSRLPKSPWVMAQKWHDLLFCHLPVEKELLQSLIPPQLELDLYKDQAWVSIIPFKVSGTRLRLLPPLPYFHQYLEVNVRTYVTYKGVPGIYFITMFANKWPAVILPKVFSFLPYEHAVMKTNQIKDKFRFRCQGDISFDLEYCANTSPSVLEQGSLDYWLMERYCFFTTKQEAVYQGDIYHDRWQVSNAEAVFHVYPSFFLKRTLGKQSLFHLAHDKQVVAWTLKRIN